MWKGRGGSSLPECCYSGPHASASVSANERNSALFHLVSLDQELASPKTDAARGTDGGRKTERENHGKIGDREKQQHKKRRVMGRKRWEEMEGITSHKEWWRGGVDFGTHFLFLSVSHTHAAAY